MNSLPNDEPKRGPGERTYLALRDRIVRGSDPPGARLPTRAELEASFDTSRVTIQRALNRLTEEGFVESRGRAGTFVKPHPPHLSRYALAFAAEPDSGRWTGYHESLRSAARSLEQRPARRIPVFHDLNAHEDCRSRHRLEEELKARRLAGVLFAMSHELVEGTYVTRQQHTPMVELLSHPIPEPRKLPNIAPDFDAWLNRALDALAEQGRQRVAVINPASGSMDVFYARLNQACETRGMRTERRWVQMLRPQQPEWARHLAALIMHGPPTERPDGLLIGDDHLVDRSLVGLADAGAVPDHDVSVIALFNAPLGRSAPVPGGVHRLGFDLAEMCQRGLELIDAIRRDQDVAPQTLIPPRFAQELGLTPPLTEI